MAAQKASVKYLKICLAKAEGGGGGGETAAISWRHRRRGIGVSHQKQRSAWHRKTNDGSGVASSA
jgi:hypothetical protein